MQQAQRACRGQDGVRPGHGAAHARLGARRGGGGPDAGGGREQCVPLRPDPPVARPGGLPAGRAAVLPGLLTSAPLAGLRRELDRALYTNCRPIADWLSSTYGVRYSVSDLTDLLHRLGFGILVTTGRKITLSHKSLFISTFCKRIENRLFHKASMKQAKSGLYCPHMRVFVPSH